MQFEEMPDEELRYRMTMEGDEVETTGAAYREHIHQLAASRMTGEIPEYCFRVALWVSDTGGRWISTSNPEDIARILEAFHARTSDSINDIPMITAEPPFDNLDIARRYALGVKALELAKLVRGERDVIKFREILDEPSSSVFPGIGEGESRMIDGDAS